MSRENNPVNSGAGEAGEVERRLDYHSCNSEDSCNSEEEITAGTTVEPVVNELPANLEIAEPLATSPIRQEQPVTGGSVPEQRVATPKNSEKKCYKCLAAEKQQQQPALFSTVGASGLEEPLIVTIPDGQQPVSAKPMMTGNRFEVVVGILAFIGLFIAMIVGESNDRTSTFNTARIGAANFVNDVPQAAATVFLLSLLPQLFNIARMVSHYRAPGEQSELERAGDYGKFAALPYLVTLLVLTLNAGANASMQNGISSALTADPASAKSLFFMTSMIISMSIVVGWVAHLGYECTGALFHTGAARNGQQSSQGSSMDSQDGDNPERPGAYTEQTSLLAANRGRGSL